MKKTLLAIAALAATSGAFAQSSVTLYGVVDASIENVKGDKGVTRVSSDNLATSRLGFKGSEDLGGGLRANFALETAVKSDTGANGGGTARFFDRAAWVGLQGGFGELRLGRIDSSIGALAGDTKILGAQAYDDFKIAKTRAGDSYRRVDNAITYLLPTFLPGLTAQLQYSTAVGTAAATGTELSGVDAGKAYGLNIKYAAGPFFAGVGYLSAKDETASIPATATAVGNVGSKGNATLAYVGYDFGVLKLTGYYDTESQVTGADRLSLAGIRVGVPITENFSLQASLSQASNVGFAPSNSDHDDATIASIKAVYNLSKRTSVYGLATNVNNESLANLNVSGVALTTLGKSSRGIAFGVAHAF
ncbi:porin [Aquabacterium sp. CECT 9606]|uniref:porin n=1 Tax=Aquabacterium sp. CECT 9606 TaxID=2845822 RepID=UPI001E351636|nr:porin [Aquabacterium sp. CECT 9606]CAH0354487.1 Outer membrane porin protein 32 [Aquabacterium sp. CECT 9606]